MKEVRKRNQDTTWRSIEQTGFRPSGSVTGSRRQKKHIKRLALILGVYFLIIGVSVSLYLVFNGFLSEKKVAIAEGWIDFKFETDGILKRDNIVNFLDISQDDKLIDIDIFSVKERLESLSQVKSAHVERLFPKTLTVLLQEYQPVAKIAATEKRERHVLYVSEEGVVFSLINKDELYPYHLPFLGGVKVLKEEGKYLPISGVRQMAPLLENARREKVHLYNDWRIIYLDQSTYAGDSLDTMFTIQSSKLGLITFSSKDPIKQLEKLDYILQDVEARKVGKVQGVDLSLGDHASIQLENKRFKNI